MHGGTDNEHGVFGLGLETGGKIADRRIVGEGGEGGHEQSLANVRMAVFGQVSFALTGSAGTVLSGIETGHGDRGGGIVKAEQVKGNEAHRGERANARNGAQEAELSLKGGNGLSERAEWWFGAAGFAGRESRYGIERWRRRRDRG